MRTDDLDAVKSKLYGESEPFLSAHPNYDIRTLPSWVERTEELMLAMNAGARAIENTRHYHGAIYTKDVFLESPQEIPYLHAAKVLREVSDAPAADVAPVVHGRWVCVDTNTEQFFLCNRCKKKEYWESNYCPNCGCRMDGGDSDAAD